MLNADETLDRYFPEVRAWLIQIAAVLDRCDRATTTDARPLDRDARLQQLRESLKVLSESAAEADRAERIQLIFSDPVADL